MLRPALSILLAISLYNFADVVLGYYKERLQAHDLQKKCRSLDKYFDINGL